MPTDLPRTHTAAIIEQAREDELAFLRAEVERLRDRIVALEAKCALYAASLKKAEARAESECPHRDHYGPAWDGDHCLLCGKAESDGEERHG